MFLNIPESDLRRLAGIVTVTSTQFDEIIRALEQAKPTLGREALVAQIAPSTDLSGDTLDDTLALMLGLHMVLGDRETTADKLAADLVITAQAQKIDEPAVGWQAFQAYMEKLLGLKSVAQTAKAVFLTLQAPTHLRAVRVLTDARPVFADDVSKPPASFIVTHTLQLEVETDLADETYYIAINPTDMQTLKAALERALAKEKTLRETLPNSIPVLGWD